MFGSVPSVLPACNGSGAFMRGEARRPSSGRTPARRVGWAEEPERRKLPVPGRTPRIDLTAAEYQQLQGWVRAGTTAQRLARRARLILGSAAGLWIAPFGSARTE